jgi:hypothetical protein
VSEHRFDRVARTAADAVSRRSSLLAFGAAALAATMRGAPGADAKDKGSKRAKKKLKKVKKQFAQACDAQSGQCQAAVNAVCAQQMNPEQCLQVLSPCCALITDCNVGPGFTCIFSAI